MHKEKNHNFLPTFFMAWPIHPPRKESNFFKWMIYPTKCSNTWNKISLWLFVAVQKVAFFPLVQCCEIPPAFPLWFALGKIPNPLRRIGFDITHIPHSPTNSSGAIKSIYCTTCTISRLSSQLNGFIFSHFLLRYGGWASVSKELQCWDEKTWKFWWSLKPSLVSGCEILSFKKMSWVA